MNQVILLLGTNLGDCPKNLKKTINLLEHRNIVITATSSVYKTEPWGYSSDNWFFNLVIKMETNMNIISLFEEINKIELDLGREIKTEIGYSDRLIDIDILFFNDEVLNSKNLQVPHPRLHSRKFTLLPLSEIMPELIHPVFNKTIRTLLEECVDEGKSIKIGSLYNEL